MNERELFLTALEIEDPAARKAHLQSACADNAELLSRVESLLASHEGESRFLQIPVVEQIGDDLSGQTVTLVAGTGSTQGEATHPGDDPAILEFSRNQERAKMSEEISLGYLEPSTKPDSLGRLGHYEILEVVGSGAFGTVLRAFDEKLQRVVAIKVMAPELAATSPARKRFLREAQASAAIRHENVVSVYAVEEKPIPYLVMEYIPGVTLQQRLDERGPLDVPTVLRLGTQIAEGLAAAHAKDLIHRDIKPGNILLETGMRDRVKITDFGLARAADDASMTQSGTIAGTPMYMAPEQALGQKLDQRADLFSFGSVLYQMVSGRPPFRAASTLAVLKRLTEDTPRPIREIIPETPTWFCDIITKLHAKNPEERYQSAREIADVLANCEAQLKSQAGLRDYSLIPRAKAQPAAGVWKWVAVAALVLPLLAIGLYAVTRPGTEPKGAKEGTSLPPITETSRTTWNGWPADAPQPAIAPFEAKQARQHQEKWAEYLGVPVEYTNALGMKFILIPPGEFTMGSTAAEIEAALKIVYPSDRHWQECLKSEAPAHKVILTQPIYLGIHEVTQAQYEKVMGQNPSHFAPQGMGKEAVAGMETSNHPVEMVSWNDAAEFCAKLSNLEKLKKSNGKSYSLPSEAEWEFACRAGTATRFWIGDKDEDLVRAGWFGESSGGRTHVAGELKANPYGLYDTHGNVWEWVQDGWDPSFYGEFQQKPAINPSRPLSADSERVVRGGRWYHSASYCRSSARLAVPPTDHFDDLGFRVSLTIDAVKAAIAAKAAKPVASTGSHTWPEGAPKPAIAPFDAGQAKAHQDAWAKHLGVRVEYTNSIGMKFMLIPPGEFTMGSTAAEIEAALQEVGEDKEWQERVKSEGPQHKVILTQPIFLGVHEVTQADYERVIGTNPSHFAPQGAGKEAVPGVDTSKHPVEMVSWNDAAEFAARLSSLEQLKPFYSRANETISPQEGNGYRLPSEAEWEYACRAGTSTGYWTGDKDEDLALAGRFDANSGGRTHPVGLLKANPFGLYDIHGSVWEWVQDGWEPGYYSQFQGKPATDPHSPFTADSQHLLRGGNWSNTSSYCRASIRYAGRPTHRDHTFGFRVALTVDAVKQAQKLAVTPANSATPAPPFPAAEVKRIAALPAPEQIDEVRKEMKKRNPDYTGEIELIVENERVTRLVLQASGIRDLSPARALPHLEYLECSGSPTLDDLRTLQGSRLRILSIRNSGVSDLKPLQGMKLQGLECSSMSKLTDLSPLRGMPLTGLSIAFTPVQDLSPLQGMNLADLNCESTAVSDLSLLAGMPLVDINYRGTKVTDISALKGMPLTRVTCDFNPDRDAQILREIKTLQFINNQPAAKFWKEVGFAPFPAAKAKRIAALPVAEQIEEVRKEMKMRNPDFDGTLVPTNENDSVTKLEFFTNNVEDISPIRAFTHLTALNCRADGAIPGKLADLKPLQGMQLQSLTLSVNKVSDLAPLQGMPLTDLYIDNSLVADLTALKGMQLKVLNCSYTQVSSLKILEGMPLTILWCNHTAVDDITPVKDMPLVWFTIQGTKVKDLSPLKGMPLTQIYLDFDLKRDGEILRSLTTLQKINDKPVEEFWKEMK
ncbi:MAG: SUMF1/EgtB/PvdO family nonheme iron enzyme [Pirellulaceae bacterium]